MYYVARMVKYLIQLYSYIVKYQSTLYTYTRYIRYIPICVACLYTLYTLYTSYHIPPLPSKHSWLTATTTSTSQEPSRCDFAHFLSGPERLSDILGALSFLLRCSGEKAFQHSDITRLYAYIPICSIYLTSLYVYIPIYLNT